ncbi:uncharacterized protein LOC142237131 [Haematobia irritans]|uniref:uncharacterized protein LOC142237131 n=1 Tax=Haematobia irritans TaxID=7368 RepID=UPI003F5069E0
MYSYGDSILFDGVSDVYLVSIATALLSFIIAYYYINFPKEENGLEIDQTQNHSQSPGETEDEYLDEDYMQSDDAGSEMESHYKAKDQGDSDGVMHNFDSTTDCDTDYDDDDDEELPIDGLVGKLKSQRVKELEAKLTREQLEEERRVEREQLAAIFELLKKQEAELNMQEIGENELNAQLSLYR